MVLLPICGIFQLALRRWDVQSSYGFAVQKANAGIERMQADGANAISDSTDTTPGGNTIYYFTVPPNADKDPSGNYVPEIVNSQLTYVNGIDIGFYLSDITGNVNVINGTVLWRATRPSGGANWTPDASWSKVNTNVARCDQVQSFTFDGSAAPPNAVDITLTVQQTQGHTVKAYTVSRRIYEPNHN